MRKFVSLFAALTVAALAMPATGAAKSVHLKAKLKGKHEVPGPGDSDGRGKAKLRLNAAKGKVCFRIRSKNIDGVSAAHIHAGAKGTSGDVVVALFAGSGGSKLKGCVTDVAAGTINDIVGSPRGFYVNVHNTDFPDGAIRGQLRKDKH